jgi:hypothetical protein
MGADTLEECLSLHFDSKGRIDGFAFPEHDRLYPSASKLKDVDELAKAYLGFKFHKETALAIGYWKGQQSKIYTYEKNVKHLRKKPTVCFYFKLVLCRKFLQPYYSHKILSKINYLFNNSLSQFLKIFLYHSQ